MWHIYLCFEPWTEILKALTKNKATIFEKFGTPYSVTIYGNPSAEVIEIARRGGVDVKEFSLLVGPWMGLLQQRPTAYLGEKL